MRSRSNPEDEKDAPTSSRRGPPCRHHQQPADVRREWLAQVPFPFVVEEGPESRAAVRKPADRFRDALG
ncbi:MAG: hypothetical protein R2719_00495 [Micropruina sp.]